MAAKKKRVTPQVKKKVVQKKPVVTVQKRKKTKLVMGCLIIFFGLFVFPVTSPCHSPTQGCTPPPDESGYIRRITEVKPLGVLLLELVLPRTNIPFYYSSSLELIKYK